ncbi:hypothetical protein V2J09_018257 [Rumex salicifolius]
MMVSFSTAFSKHVRFLLQSLDGSNSDSVYRELCEFADGSEENVLVLRACFDHIDVYGRDLKHIHSNSAIASFIKYLLAKPNFSTVFCEAVRSEAIEDGFLDNLSDAFCLSVSEKIAVGLALSNCENPVTGNFGKSFCVSQIEGLLANPGALGSIEQVQQILMFLQQSEDLSKHVDTFLRMLSLVPQNETHPSILAPLISNESEDATLLRNLDYMYDSENDFDAVVAEMEREMNIAGIMKELGYGCTDDANNCKQILSFLSPLTEPTVSKIIGTVVCTQGGMLEGQNAFPIFLSATGCNFASDMPELSSWNINVLVDSIKELAPNTNWVRVMESMDYEGFCIPDENAFICLMSIFKLACEDPFPIHSICGSVWNNAEGQLSFLKYAVSSPAEMFTFSRSARQLELLDSIQGLKLESQLFNHAWFCLDLLDVLCQLAERGYRASVQSILEYPLKHCPEVLLLGLAQIKTAYNLVQYELSLSIFPRVICSTSSDRNGIIMQIWLFNPLLLGRAFLEALTRDSDNIARIVDICDEIKILNLILKMMPFTQAIKLAEFAFNKELLDLEKWLSDNLVTYRDTFVEECLKYLKEIQFETSEQERIHHSGVSLNIHSLTVAVFLKVLQANSHSISSSHLCEEIDRLSISLRHGSMSQTDGNSEASSATVTFDDDVESEANSYFQRMFSEQLAISEMVEMLSRFKDSSDPREKSIFACVINNLFEEYRFFPKYPEKQLGLAAVLFGSVIKNQLVTHIPLGIAIRRVLDALRKPADSKMFGFGTKALEQFINRLDEWPQYCNHILQISHLRGNHPELVAYIEGVLTRRSHGGSGLSVDHLGTSISVGTVNEMLGSTSAQPVQQLPTSKLHLREHVSLDDGISTSANMSNFLKPPLSSATHSIAPSSEGIGNQKNATSAPTPVSLSPGLPRQSRGITSTRFGSALNIETLLSAAERRQTPIEAPAPEVQDKVSFIINNLSAANIEAKAKEFSEVLTEQYFPWFAQYMVMKRASIESNFHELYLKFLEKANSKALNKEVLKTTYENCKVLLGSELIKSSSEERSLLKNLGSWLGKLTIGRNQVLRARDIDPKSLIIEAYEKGLMIAVIPFTSKILEPCQSSLAYQPPNPWTMAILSLLAEIYAMPNLKMNLKFDIEVLFKNLGVNMKDVAPTSLLKDRVRVFEGNPDFSNKDMVPSHPTIEDKPVAVPLLPSLDIPLEVTGPPHLGGHPHPMYGTGRPSIEDEKLPAIGFPDQLAPAPGLLPSVQSQSPFTVNSQPAIPSITQHIVVNPKIGAMGLHHHFQRALPVALERAINEIVPGIAQRSVSIAVQTTKELVIKDYALESDENRICNAAHLMVGSLAGSLAHVTCKVEPLRASLTNQLRTLLQTGNITGNIANELLENAILLATNDNLDLGCAHIENSAAEKGVEIVDAEIAQQLALRRKQGLGSSMYDASGYAQSSISVLPESLQPKPGRVSLSQQRVYEDFARLPWQNQQASPNANVLLNGPPASVSLPRPFSSSSGQFNRGLYSPSLGPIAQPLTIASDKIDASVSQNLSAGPLNQGRNDEAAIQQHEDSDATIMSSSAALAIPELLPAESSVLVKDPGAPSQQLTLPSPTERFVASVSEPLLSTGDALDKYQMVASKLEALLANDSRETDIQSAVSEIPQIILRCVSRDEAALAVAQKVFRSLYENSSSILHVAAHLAILVAIRDVCKLVVKELTNWVIYSDEERRFNRDVTVGLIRKELLNLAEYNIQMAKLLDGGRHKAATEFAISLVQTLSSEEPKVLSELHNVVDSLIKLSSKPGSPESLQQLVEIARNPSSNINAPSSMIAGMEDKSRQTRDKKVISQDLASRVVYSSHPVEAVEPDNSGFHEQVSSLFVEWFQICELHSANDAAASKYILQLHQSGLLKGDDTCERFFRILLELSVSHCLTSEVISPQQSSQQAQPLSFLAIDIYAKLVFSILKYCPVEQGSSKLFLLPKILAVTVRVIQKDSDEKKSVFNARPYFRLFINWLLDIGSLDPVHDGVNLQVLTAFANAFHSLQPLRVPAFSFAWLELVSHRTFMPKLLTGNSQKGWPYLHRLLVDLFQFMEPFLRNAELGQAIHFLYRGTLRVLLVLLHDFPEFLCDYHFSFCDVIPPSCIQMRNIVLSAFPRNMRLPDPSTPNLKIDMLAEMIQPPRILSEVDAALKAKQMKADLDEYLKTRQQQGSSFLIDLKQRLLLSQSEANRTGTRYNVPLINSLVLYVGNQAIQQLQPRTPSQPQSASNSVWDAAALDIFQTLIMELDTEGRYLFLNALANQLRYPNNHTHYFSFIMLLLFSESNQEIVQEQITRVLLERLIVNRPHPWGLLITFIELIKNPRYKFWSRSFTHCAPEIEKLFDSVSRSCGGQKPVNDGMVGAGALPEPAH